MICFEDWMYGRLNGNSNVLLGHPKYKTAGAVVINTIYLQ